MNTHYSLRNYPYLVCNHGNWNIHANEKGWCAAIPTQSAAAVGCHASHFGNLEYVKNMLGVNFQIGANDGRV